MINAILQTAKDIIKLIQTLVKWPLIGAAGLLLLFCLCMLGHYAYLRFIKKIPVKHGAHRYIPKESIIKRIFWDLPKQWAIDFCQKNPDEFPTSNTGLIIFCGPQGNGKSISLIEQTLRQQKEYPKCKVLSNMHYKYQDQEMTDWHQMLDKKYNNGKYGKIIHLDEIQSQQSSLQSRGLDPSLLELISQQRKQKTSILATSQVWTRVAKAFREQTKEIRKCYTYFGCLTIVHRIEPVLVDGELKEEKSRGWYFFIHNKKLREAYDTFYVIESLAKAGAKEGVDIPNAEPSKTEINYYDMTDKKKKKK